MENNILVHNIGELVTLSPLAEVKKTTHVRLEDLGCLENSWLAVQNGQVLDFGIGEPPSDFEKFQKVDAGGKLVLPGLVDCHTHPIFGGNRSDEFSQRLDGKSYQEIAAAGGGIKSTIQHTRATENHELSRRTRNQLDRFASYGVTTVECKSGYGQSATEELRMLRILKDVKASSPLTLTTTYLALHARPSEFPTNQEFSSEMITILQKVKEEGLADWVDGFVEKGYFEPEDCEEFFTKASQLGLGIRIHADEFADSGAASAAAQWGAASADHLEKASDAGIKAMSSKGVVAVLLPGTSVYSKIDYADARPFVESGCAVALATDYNPGSCQIDNLPLIATLGALHCNMTTAQAIAGVTFVAAKALGLENRKGSLAKGYDGDFLIHELESKEQWIADFGRHLPSQVFVRGQKIRAH